MDQNPNRTNPDELLSLTEAAQRLGIAYDTARKRLKAGTLQGERQGGRWYIRFPNPESDPETKSDKHPDDSGTIPDETEPNADALVAQLRDEVSFLRQQVERQTHIIAGLIQRIPDVQELSSGIDADYIPQDANTASSSRGEAGKASEPWRNVQDAPQPPWRRWWRRMTGGD